MIVKNADAEIKAMDQQEEENKTEEVKEDGQAATAQSEANADD